MGATEEKLKHLEFIQSVITRMNSNSFLIKGWTVTLVSAVFALAAKDTNPSFVLIAYIPIPMFWGLDAFFLSQERQYRALFDETAKTQPPTHFSMDASKLNHGWNSLPGCVFSKTLLPFYVTLIALTVVIMRVLMHR